MEKNQAYTVENFIGNWNGEFPDYELTAADLKKSHSVMAALFQIFDRLGVDRDAVVLAPEETCNENIMYYWDLIPVVNTTRIVNSLVTVMPHYGSNVVSILHFLQPTVTSSHSILLLIFNFMLFHEQRFSTILLSEEDLISFGDKVKSLEDRKNKVMEMLNEQAQGKGKRAERLEKIEHDREQFEEELKREKEAHNIAKQESDVHLNEIKQLEVLLEQKRSHREVAIADVEKRRAQRVYDAQDVKAQVEQAARNVQEAEEKLNSLEAILMQKDNSLKNLQAIKPNLTAANNLLYEIIKFSKCFIDIDSEDLDEGGLKDANTKCTNLETKFEELRVSRPEAAKRRQGCQARRQQKRINLREVEDKEKKREQRSRKAQHRVQEIQHLTIKYEKEKVQGTEEIAKLKESFIDKLTCIEDRMMKICLEVKKKIEDKLL